MKQHIGLEQRKALVERQGSVVKRSLLSVANTQLN